jgi:polar amino acid transport system permease protein
VTTAGWQPSQLQRDREAYRRSRTRRAILIAVAGSAIVVTLAVVVVGGSSGWPRVRDSFFDFGAGWDQLPQLLRALWTNVQIMVIAEVFVLVFAALIAILRTLPGTVFFPVRFLMALYTDVFRGVPFLVVLYIVGYGLPALNVNGIPTSPFVLGTIALVLTYSAYVAEVLRAGIESVHPSQRAAARSLGLSYAQTMRFVVFPQAVRRVLPPLLNDFVSLQKDTALVSVLSVFEVVLAAEGQVSQDYKFVHYVFAGLIFLAFTVPLTRFTDWISRRKGWIGAGGGIR